MLVHIPSVEESRIVGHPRVEATIEFQPTGVATTPHALKRGHKLILAYMQEINFAKSGKITICGLVDINRYIMKQLHARQRSHISTTCKYSKFQLNRLNFGSFIQKTEQSDTLITPVFLNILL
jgi:hypothetical protein